MARFLTFTGVGILNTWAEPSELQSTISNTLLMQGWGVTNVNITGNALIWAYNISISISVPDNENPERVKQGLIGNLNGWFHDTRLTLSADSGNPSLNDTNGILGDIKNAIIGNQTSVDDAVNTGGKILGLSTGTIIAVGLGYLLVNLMLSGKRR